MSTALSRMAQQKAVSLSGTGGELVAAVPKKVITVIGLYGDLGGTSPTLTLQSRGGAVPTALGGALSSSPVQMQPSECCWTKAAEGESLFAVLAGTTPTFEGFLIYTQA